MPRSRGIEEKAQIVRRCRYVSVGKLETEGWKSPMIVY